MYFYKTLLKTITDIKYIYELHIFNRTKSDPQLVS